MNLATEQKSLICLEEGLIPVADEYIYFQSINSYCLEEVNMVLEKIYKIWNNKSSGTIYPIIPNICACGCNGIIWNRSIFIHGHNTRVRNPATSEETKKKLSESHKGLLAGSKHPNFGKHLSAEVRLKISKANKGKKLSDEAKRKISVATKGRVGPNKGKTGLRLWYRHSEETKQKIGKGNNGKHRSEECKKNLSENSKGRIAWNKGKKGIYSNESLKQMSESRRKGLSNGSIKVWCEGKTLPKEMLQKMSGPNHHNWQGGISFEPYCSKFNNQLKEQIRERDKRTCQLCGIKENGRKLTVHHIHYDKPNCNPDLISLCLRCNNKVNTNRDMWEAYFLDMLKKKDYLTKIYGDLKAESKL